MDKTNGCFPVKLDTVIKPCQVIIDFSFRRNIKPKGLRLYNLVLTDQLIAKRDLCVFIFMYYL